MARPRQRSLFLTLVSLLPAILAALTTLNMSSSGCLDKCGNITISYPFGTQHGCYRDGFDVTCNNSTDPPKLFMGSQPASNLELIDINITTGEARAYIYIGFQCYDQIDNKYLYNAPWVNLEQYPSFLFSNQRNKFTAIGCSTLAYIVGGGKRSHSYISGCVSFCESLNSTTGDEGSCTGFGCCQTAIPTGLNFYEVQWGNFSNSAWDNYSNSAWEFMINLCNYAMLVEDDWYKFQVQDLSGTNFFERNGKVVQVVLDWAIRDSSGTCLNGVEHSSNPACLSNNSTCNNTSNGNGYLCQCKPGYEGNPYLPSGCRGN